MIGTIRQKLSGGSLAGDAVLTTAVGFGVFFLSAVTGPLLARSLGATSRGDLAAVLVPTQLIGTVLLLGIPFSSAYYAHDLPRHTLTMTAWVTMAGLFVPVVLLGMVIVPHYLADHDPITRGWFVAFLALWLCFLPAAATLETFRGAGQVKRFNALRALPFVINFFGIVGLAAFDRLTLRSALGCAFVSQALGWTATFTVGRTWPGRGFRRGAARKQFHYGLRAAIGTLAMTVVTKIDQFVLVPLVEPRVLGLYVVAATGASITTPLGQGISMALFPHIRSTDRAESDRRTRQALLWTGFSSSSVALVVGLSASLVIPGLFGEEFRGAVAPLLLLLPGQVFGDLGNVQASRLEADNRPGSASIALSIAALVTVVGLLIAVEPFGIKGAATVTSIAQLSYLAAGAILLRRGPRNRLAGDEPDGSAGAQPASAP